MIELIPWKENHKCGIYQDGVHLVLSSFCCDGVYADLTGGRSKCSICSTEYSALTIDGKDVPTTLDLRKANAKQVVAWIRKWRADLNNIEVQIT